MEATSGLSSDRPTVHRRRTGMRIGAKLVVAGDAGADGLAWFAPANPLSKAFAGGRAWRCTGC